MNNPHPLYKQLKDNLLEQRDVIAVLDDIEDLDACTGANPRLMRISILNHQIRLQSLVTEQGSLMRQVQEIWKESDQA